MGANFSSQRSQLFQDIQNLTDQTCAPGVAVQQNIRSPNFDLNNCPNFAYTAANNNNISVNCSMESYASALVKSAQEMTTEQKVGLGFNAASNDQEMKQKILQKLNQLCAPKAITNQVIGVDPTVIDLSTRIDCETSDDCRYPGNGDYLNRPYGACEVDKKCRGTSFLPNTVRCLDSPDVTWNDFNTSSATSNCVMLAVQNASADAKQISKTTQSGMNIALIIGLVIGGLIVIGVLAYVIKRGMRKDAMAAR